MSEISNADRATWALAAIGNFVEATRVDTAMDAITDLVGNLIHLARGRGLDTEAIICNALAMAHEEAQEDDEGDMEMVQVAFRKMLAFDQ